LPAMPQNRTMATATSAVQIGALVPLSPPGWVEAGRHLLAGLELAVRDVNDAGGIAGRPLELVVRDTAANPQTAVSAVDELARVGVAALAGEYHSVVARAAAARADALTERPTQWDPVFALPAYVSHRTGCTSNDGSTRATG
jgi:ABC-type branched-subunit amino acid transport system substrate-binding protein